MGRIIRGHRVHSSHYRLENIVMQLIDIGDDDTDEEVDHGDGAEEDHGEEQHHREEVAHLVPRLVKPLLHVRVLELSQHHGHGPVNSIVIRAGKEPSRSL